MDYKAFLQPFNFQENDIQSEYWREATDYNILLAPTGSGKTLAFLVKALENNVFPLLIISPTRELVLQLSDNFKKFLPTHTVVSCYGGHAIEHELNQLKNNPQIVIGTPGRLLDHMRRDSCDFSQFKQLIIDEYDKLLELNFREEVNQFLAASKWKAIQLCSATKLDHSESILTKFSWKIIDLLKVSKPLLNFYQVEVEESEKVEQLVDFLVAYKNERIIVFCAHREACERIHEHLQYNRVSAAIYHGGLKQSERERAFIKFNRDSERILLCTDLAARGLDLPQVNIVVHYQPALDETTQTHRNGRTGRNGEKGAVVYFAFHPSEYTFPNASKLPLLNAEPSGSYVTLYCDAGRKQKLRKTDFVGFLCQEIGVDGKAINGIDIFDNHAYVTIEGVVYKQIKEQISNTKIKRVSIRMNKCY